MSGPIYESPPPAMVPYDQRPPITGTMQAATAHSIVARSDSDLPVNIGYSFSNATLRSAGDIHQYGRVHLPISNPPNMTSAHKLVNINVKFDRDGDVMVNELYLHFDENQEYVGNWLLQTASFSLTIPPENIIAYNNEAAMCISLDIKFANTSASLYLFSVSLVFAT